VDPRFHSVRLDSLAALHPHRHGLTAYCAHCPRFEEIDLGELVARGYGARLITRFSARCALCGERGEVRVRVPTTAGRRTCGRR